MGHQAAPCGCAAEYVAGGEILLLGVDEDKNPAVGSYAGTGVHSGVIHIRVEVANSNQTGATIATYAHSPAGGVLSITRDGSTYYGQTNALTAMWSPSPTLREPS